jgi:hypothetical protein
MNSEHLLLRPARKRNLAPRLRQNYPTGKSILIFRNRVKPHNQKYSASPAGANQCFTCRVSPDERGGSRSSRNARWDAVDARACERRTLAIADGEAVWSWRRDAGAKLVRSKLLRGDGDNKPAHRGEHEISRQPLRRESRIASAGPVCSCAFFEAHVAHETAGAARIRLPCALLFFRGCQSTQSSGALHAATMRTHTLLLFEI